MIEVAGYLVVLKEPEYALPPNPRYKGVFLRVPVHPARIPEEASAIDEYIFGRRKDETTNVIIDREDAEDLLALFASSPREYELMYVQTVGEREEVACPGEFRFLGVDVANVLVDYWSIVGDFAPELVDEYGPLLNELGLFQTARDAWAYLREYKRRRLADWDSGFDVVVVCQVPTR